MLNFHQLFRAMKERVELAVRRRKNSHDQFRERYGYSWDYVIVFKVYDDNAVLSNEQQTYSLKYVLSQLAAGGLEFRLSYSVQVRIDVLCEIQFHKILFLIPLFRFWNTHSTPWYSAKCVSLSCGF
jgi:hypothetical protein